MIACFCFLLAVVSGSLTGCIKTGNSDNSPEPNFSGVVVGTSFVSPSPGTAVSRRHSAAGSGLRTAAPGDNQGVPRGQLPTAQAYSDGCTRAASRFSQLALAASDMSTRIHLEGIAEEFTAKAAAPERFYVEYFGDTLRDFLPYFATVFGSIDKGMKIFDAFVAAHMYSGTPTKLKFLLTRTMNRAVMNGRPLWKPPRRLDDVVVDALLDVFENIIPLRPGFAVAVDLLTLQLTNIDTAVDVF